jgi:putative FmdB family regulatory protein
MPLYDYNCKRCEHVFEAFRPMAGRQTAECPDCGDTCEMKLTAPHVALDPISGDFPGATMAWEKRRKQKMKQEVKQDKQHLE